MPTRIWSLFCSNVVLNQSERKISMSEEFNFMFLPEVPWRHPGWFFFVSKWAGEPNEQFTYTFKFYQPDGAILMEDAKGSSITIRTPPRKGMSPFEYHVGQFGSFWFPTLGNYVLEISINGQIDHLRTLHVLPLNS